MHKRVQQMLASSIGPGGCSGLSTTGESRADRLISLWQVRTWSTHGFAQSSLTSELTSLERSSSALRPGRSYAEMRAKAAGVAEDALEEATDADDPKAAVISLLLETASAGEDKPRFDPAPAAAAQRTCISYLHQPPHSHQARDAQLPVGPPSPGHARLRYADTARNHMLDGREERHGRRHLRRHGECGVERVVVVCFMSEKYQQSANCMLEVKLRSSLA